MQVYFMVLFYKIQAMGMPLQWLQYKAMWCWVHMPETGHNWVEFVIFTFEISWEEDICAGCTINPNVLCAEKKCRVFLFDIQNPDVLLFILQMNESVLE